MPIDLMVMAVVMWRRKRMTMNLNRRKTLELEIAKSMYKRYN
jgi:hypothetical protein